MVRNGKIVESQQFQRKRDKSRPVGYLAQLLSFRSWFFKFSLTLLLVLSFIWLWQKLSDPTCFPVKEIKISGDLTTVSKDNLQQVILPFIAKGFFRLDSRGLKEQILQLPWIASVTIKRFWPNTLMVAFTTRKPIAFIGNHSLLDAQGNIFSPGQANLSSFDLPIFSGPLGQQKYLLQNYLIMAPLLANLNLKIKLLKLVDKQFWYLQLSNGLSLYLSQTESGLQLRRFVEVYLDVIASKVSMIDYVDLRYAHGMAVKFKKQISS